ncbi:MAG: DNA repair ATPase [Clostridium sp.]
MSGIDEKEKSGCSEKKSSNEMGSGTYEVIKNRLIGQGEELRTRVSKLNEVRRDVFGSIETKLLGSDRIITENNCIPRDMAPVGNNFIFGYNVHIGLKSKVLLSDVFSIYKYENKSFIKQGLELINNEEFINDFEELYTYYKNTFFAKFTVTDVYFYMIFQTGKSPFDIKVFKWAIEEDKLRYVDSRSDHEVRFQNRNELKFIKATRDDQRSGIHPHVSILDRVFVETIGGDLTIKVEDNTTTGKGIYSEVVEDKDQSLDDSEIYYADLEQITILKIKPYKEKDFRYFIFNNKLKTVIRVDSIKDTCVSLPTHHGIIFPCGYYLQNGEYKLFDVDCNSSVFDAKISSSNGEDFQYIFYNVESGVYLIYSYNIIEQKIDTPIICSGYSHFDNGEMIVFKHENEPRKNHMIQIWQTPYVGKNHVADGDHDSLLFKIGNKDIVLGMSDIRGVCKLISKGEGYQSIYVDIVRECERIIDSYFWLDKEEVFNLKEVLLGIKETSTFAIGEFEKVIRIKRQTKNQIEEVSIKSEELLKTLKYGTFEDIDDYVKGLGEIRKLRGDIAALKELKYTNLTLVEELDNKVKEKYDEFTTKCVEFLLDEKGLKPYESKVDLYNSQIEGIVKSTEGTKLLEKMDEASMELELLIDIISNFDIKDPTVTTEIIEKISSLFSLINNGKARVRGRVLDITKKEMSSQFNSQIKLLSQSVVNYLDISNTVEKCDEYLNKVMIMIQELEGKFAEFDEYVTLLGEKREELYNAFEGKKQYILDKTNKKILSLFSQGERILSGMENRIRGLNTVLEIQSYFATDILVEKVRDIIRGLNELSDNVKGDEISSRLKTLKEDGIRALNDRNELYVDGENIIRLGKHKFSVNKTPIDLSMVEKNNKLFYHITGTDFFDEVVNEEILKYKNVFSQSVVSENDEVYRGEYLAYLILEEYKDSLDELSLKSQNQLLEFVQKFMESRYDEGYTKGVHDRDATSILSGLLELDKKIDLLVYSNKSRSMARLFWNSLACDDDKEIIINRLKELVKVSKYFNTKINISSYTNYIKESMEKCFNKLTFLKGINLEESSEYLAFELIKGEEFVVSKEGKLLYDSFIKYLSEGNNLSEFKSSVDNSRNDLEGLYYFVLECVNSYFINYYKEEISKEVLIEVVIILMENSHDVGRVIYIDSNMKVTGLIGSHNNISSGEYVLNYNSFRNKLNNFKKEKVVEFQAFQNIKKKLLSSFREQIHLNEFKSNVLTSFVRNKLIDKVYLPLIGDNLAKQIGVVGDEKRTDLMGLLLLLSPPGYGKTTLIEYVANRIGLNLIKINGPALGNEVTSLDPDRAPNKGARDELNKLNISLKMGNNVLIYIDDIQHCSPEFLQKFISLCDGQRKIEGVYNGISQSYDLRGKKVCVVMAGNPYTESGEKFKIPDMLSNRADVYNLGDMLKESEEAFKLSYIENAVTSNEVLSKLSNSNPKDIYGLIKMAEGESRESVDLECDYSVDELNEYISVLEKLIYVRDIVLRVNMEYIYSAAQEDEFRKEPPFKLQGSYRNMNKISEKIIGVMNEEELFKRILISYENDAQTLTSGAEFNMLKWKEIISVITKDEKKRLEEIRAVYLKNKMVTGEDQVARAVFVLSALTENIEMIKDILGSKM